MKIKTIPAGSGFDRITEAVTTEYGQLIGLVQMALREKLRGTPGAGDYYVGVTAIYADRVVCSLNGRLQSYPYSLAADNTVTIGDGTEVVMQFAPVREAAADLPATFREAADGSIECTLIEAGTSKNGNYYPDAVLRDAAQLFEGVRVFNKPDAVHTQGGGKDVANLLGGIYSVRFIEGAAPDTGRLVGTFRPINPADPVVTKMVEAVRRGMQALMGLSIDAEARTRRLKLGTATVRAAQAITKVHSVDLIVEPGAGGGLDRLTEAAATAPDSTIEQPAAGETMLKQRLYEAIKAKNPARAAGIDLDKITDDELVTLHEAVCGAAAEPAKPAAAVAPTGAAAPLTRAEFEAATALREARAHARLAVTTSTLPQVAKDKLMADLLARDRLTEADVDKAVTAEREYLARFTESGRPVGGMPRIEVGDRRAQVLDMLDAFFDPKHKDHRNVISFRECYREITGDQYVTGRFDRARLTESIGTDTFAQALGDSVTRRMQQEYREAVAWDAWSMVCSPATVMDFRSQQRTEIGGFGDLPVVAERAPYTAFSDPSDDAATYTVAKRGGISQISMEAIKNDDVNAIRRVPMNLGRAAKRTLYGFVFDTFVANAATTYDSVALYHASHANLFTTAFSAAQFAAHRLAMIKQTGRDTSRRMGIGPAMLLGPHDLEEAMVDAFRRNTNNDKTFVQSLTPTVIPVATWTDVNDWVTLADPRDMPVIEVGFLDGQQEPTLLMQDAPTEGSVFTNDMITYKIRHIYGKTVLVDGHKGTTKAVVA